MAGLCYTAFYNVVDYAAGVVPVSRVTEDDERLTQQLYARVDNWSDMVIESFGQQSNSVGLPVAVQCVARHGEDEIALRIMKILEPLFDSYVAVEI